jgi:hypothetical protein
MSTSDAPSAAAAIAQSYLRPAPENLARRVADYTGQGGATAQPGIDQQAIYDALSNPWISQEQRAVLTDMLDQYRQNNDPLRLLQIQQAQADLSAGPSIPSGFQALDMQAQAAGLVPGTPEYQDFMRSGGGDPSNFRALDMQARAAGYEPGTPEYQQFMATRGAGEIAAAKAQGEAQAGAEINLPATMATAQTSLDLIDAITNDPSLEGITGMVQGRFMPFSQAGTDLNVKIDQLRNRVFLEAFQSLKGAGAITEKEGDAARAALARLDRSQSTEAYREALAELRGIIERGVAKAQALASGAAAAPTGNYSTMSDDEIMRMLGGGQ